jgi:2-dehydro-3-deoxygalactonokinase
MTGEAALIALDWGTTTARAWRLDADGSVLATRSAPLGVQAIRDGRFAPALDALLDGLDDGGLPRIACGMIGSRQGWTEVPYRAAPAALASLADGMVEVPSARLWVVPGVCTRDASGLPDVMRGEETQLLGAVDIAAPRTYAVLPGTHSKWARLESGRLADFATCITGELHAALMAHTIIGRLAREGGFDAAHFGLGVARGLAARALSHDAFGARTLALMGELPGTAIADWLSGLLIGQEIAFARRFAPDRSAVTVVAGEHLALRYRIACEQAGLAVTLAPADAAARGLWRLAVAAKLVVPARGDATDAAWSRKAAATTTPL